MSRLVQMLLELHRTEGSGVLRAELGNTKRQIITQDGLVASAESNQQDEHLVNILLNLQLLPKHDLAAISSSIKGGQTADQAVLTASKLSSTDLETGAREQVIRILASMMTWAGCALHFYEGNEHVRRKINLREPVPQVLILAARRASSAGAALSARMNLLNSTVSPSVVRNAAHWSLPLEDAEAFTYGLIGKGTLVRDLLPLIPAGSAKPEDLILRLFCLGLIRLEDPSRSEEDETQPNVLDQEIDDLQRKFEVSNFYEILSVRPDAGVEEIKTAYYELAKRYHPDRFQSSRYAHSLRASVEQLFTHITGAYAVLGNPSSRASYDEARMKNESQVDAALQARAAVDLDREKMADTLFAVGYNALVKGNFEKAIAQLKECVWLRPDVAKFHHHLGVAQSEIPRFRKDAERHLLKAIELNNMGVETYLALSKLYLSVNLPRRAEAQLQEALLWDPDNTEARMLLDQLNS